MLRLPTVTDPELQAIFDIISMAMPDPGSTPFVGTGDPNGVVTASPPATYLNRAGGAGTTLWVKESGVGTTTGWTSK